MLLDWHHTTASAAKIRTIVVLLRRGVHLPVTIEFEIQEGALSAAPLQDNVFRVLIQNLTAVLPAVQDM